MDTDPSFLSFSTKGTDPETVVLTGAIVGVVQDGETRAVWLLLDGGHRVEVVTRESVADIAERWRTAKRERAARDLEERVRDHADLVERFTPHLKAAFAVEPLPEPVPSSERLPEEPEPDDLPEPPV